MPNKSREERDRDHLVLTTWKYGFQPRINTIVLVTWESLKVNGSFLSSSLIYYYYYYYYYYYFYYDLVFFHRVKLHVKKKNEDKKKIQIKSNKFVAKTTPR
ncbi:hypothetical protein PP707_04120 [Acetobacter pasteurianus]|nr:hypothetical protein [Acetobacter pasteurianus]